MTRFFGACAALAIAAAAIIWVTAGLGPKPLLVNKSGLSQAVYDREGHLLRLTLSSDEKYRLWVPLAEIPPAMIEATLLQEDAWFRWHPGVNPLSLVRAMFTTYLGRGRRVGGSTIAMQLARLRFGINSRTFTGKIEQILQALWIGRYYTRDEILEAYLNAAPYGGNVEGVGAASIIYFGKQPRYLSVAQALTLAVIPQNPRLRNPASAGGRIALSRASVRLAESFLHTHRSAQSPDFSSNLAVTIAPRRALPFGAPHLVNRVLTENQSAPRIVTTLDPGLQGLLERQLRMFTERNGRLGINNGAVILVDYRTMQVKGYVGSADYFSDSINGQVNGLRGRRSPGSALKPFIYALAIDQGLIHPRTMLKDTAIRISAYNPENFDRDFLGPIDATSALVRSRNVPAIEVANMLAPPGLYGFLETCRRSQPAPAGLLRPCAGAGRRRGEHGGDGRTLCDACQRRRTEAAGHHHDCRRPAIRAASGCSARKPAMSYCRCCATIRGRWATSRCRRFPARHRCLGRREPPTDIATRGHWGSPVRSCWAYGSGTSTELRMPTLSAATPQGRFSSISLTRCARAAR